MNLILSIDNTLINVERLPPDPGEINRDQRFSLCSACGQEIYSQGKIVEDTQSNDAITYDFTFLFHETCWQKHHTNLFHICLICGYSNWVEREAWSHVFTYRSFLGCDYCPQRRLAYDWNKVAEVCVKLGRFTEAMSIHEEINRTLSK